MLKTVRRTIESNSMFERGDRVLVAVSGGPDSVALLRALVILSSGQQWQLTAAHLNHGLRGKEADDEEAFVLALCKTMGIPCISRSVNIRTIWQTGKGRSLEETGREVRYAFLDEVALTSGAEKIATGHHRDDQAETVLMNLLRGSGLDGLKGIPPVRHGRIVRPLLDVSRNDILAFLKREGLTFRVDPSNMDPAFLRNRIRNELIPELTARYNPRIVTGLCRMAAIVRQEDAYLQDEAHRILLEWGIAAGQQEILLNRSEFNDLHIALQGRIIKQLLETAVPGGKAIGSRHIEALLSLLRAPTCRRLALDLPGGIAIERSENRLRLFRVGDRDGGRRITKADPSEREFSYQVEIPGELYLAGIDRTIRFALVDKPDPAELKRQPWTAFLDLEEAELPLLIRSFRPGDRMVPLGMAGAKKVKKIFIDAKMPLSMRGQIPLLVDQRSVLWIAGLRFSERVRVTGKTKIVLKAEMV
jgi:tRNA(Ile)-lysidine synthase